MIRFQALWKTKSFVKVCLKFKLPLWTKGLLIHLSPLWQLPLWHVPQWHNFPVYYVRYFRRPYLYGRHFTIRTDHGSLRWLLKFKDPDRQIARWIQILGEYDYAVIHRPGKSHQNADSLSRIQCPQCSMVLGGHRLGDGDKSETPVAVQRKQEL